MSARSNASTAPSPSTTRVPSPRQPTTTALSKYKAADVGTRAMLDKVMDHDRRQDGREFWLNVAGLAVGFLVVAMLTGASVWVIMKGHPVAGTVLGTVDVAALAAIFVTRGRAPRDQQA